MVSRLFRNTLPVRSIVTESGTGATLLIAPLIAGVCALLIVSAIGYPVNFFGILALVVALGLSVDYSIFYFEGGYTTNAFVYPRFSAYDDSDLRDAGAEFHSGAGSFWFDTGYQRSSFSLPDTPGSMKRYLTQALVFLLLIPGACSRWLPAPAFPAAIPGHLSEPATAGCKWPHTVVIF